MHSTAAEIPPVSSSFHITTTTYIHTLSLSPFPTHFFTSSPSERPAAKHSTPSPPCSPLQQKRQPQEHTTGKKMHNTLVQFTSPLLRKQHKSPLLSLSLCVFVCVSLCLRPLHFWKLESMWVNITGSRRRRRRSIQGGHRPKAPTLQKEQQYNNNNKRQESLWGDGVNEEEEKGWGGASASKLTAAATKTLQNTKENLHCSLSQSRTRRR